MASYLDTITGYGGRSYNSLVISEGDMPAEAFIPSESEEVKFAFAYGPENNNNVVIPKGKILAAAGVEYDQLTETYRPAVKICTSADTPIGVAPYNVYETRYGVESENTISPITRNYIRIPLFVQYNNGTETVTADKVAASIGFGAMYDITLEESSSKPAIASAIMGKYVVSDDNGNFKVKGDLDGMDKVVGQVLAVELDTPPAGFLQYCLELGNADYADFIKKTREVLGLGQNANNRQANKTFPGMASFAYAMGYPKKGSLATDYLTQLRGGIHFLTDAYFKNKVNKKLADTAALAADNEVEVIFDEDSGLAYKVEGSTVKGIEFDADACKKVAPRIMLKLNKKNAEIARDVTLLDHFNGDEMYVTDLPEYQMLNESVATGSTYVPAYTFTFKKQISGEEKTITAKVNPKFVHYDYYNNAIVLTLADKAINASYLGVDDKPQAYDFAWEDGMVIDLAISVPVIRHEIVGLPTIRDFKGCIGTVNILLQK